MEDQRPLLDRIRTVAGSLCLGAMLAILPLGVSAVRAGDGPEKLMSVDPLLVAGEGATTPAEPKVTPVEVGDEEVIKPGSDRVEVQPGVIVLNTRGYNYGKPPAALDPDAMKRESPPGQ